MFINSSQLKKLMKRDYKEFRLTMANIEDGYSVMGVTWAVHIRHEGMPNIVKSLMVELAGDLPKPGKIFTVSKENPVPQYEADIDSGRSMHIVKRYVKATDPAYQTGIYEEFGEELYGLIQSNVNGSVIHIKKELLDLIDLEAVNGSIENLPGNACYASDFTYGIFWHNETTTLMLLPSSRDSLIKEPLSRVVFDPYLSEGFLKEEELDG